MNLLRLLHVFVIRFKRWANHACLIPVDFDCQAACFRLTPCSSGCCLHLCFCLLPCCRATTTVAGALVEGWGQVEEDKQEGDRRWALKAEDGHEIATCCRKGIRTQCISLYPVFSFLLSLFEIATWCLVIRFQGWAHRPLRISLQIVRCRMKIIGFGLDCAFLQFICAALILGP